MSDAATTNTQRRTLRDALDLLVACTALATSIASIWLAISQGDDMQRLVQAQSWPYIGFSSGNSSLDATSNQRIRSLSFTVNNQGVGPARLRTLEVLVDGKPVPSSTELMRHAARLRPQESFDRGDAYTVPVGGRVLRAGEDITFLRWHHTEKADPVWRALDDARFGRIVMRACFCSVFDECWTSRSDQPDASPVDRCPVVAAPYGE
jgi:hypothetical protein